MANAPYVRPGGDPFGQTSYLLKKQFISLGARIRIYDAGGNLALFVQQKAFKLKEDIRIYSDESMAQEILSIKARQIIDFSAAYDVVDTRTGTKVGAFRRKGWSSIVRDTWQVLDVNDMQIGEITEDSMLLATIRRFLSNLIPQGYDLNLMNGGKVADYAQKFNPFLYHLVIEFGMDQAKLLDRRMGLAGAVLLACLEGRQQSY